MTFWHCEKNKAGEKREVCRCSFFLDIIGAIRSRGSRVPFLATSIYFMKIILLVVLLPRLNIHDFEVCIIINKFFPKKFTAARPMMMIRCGRKRRQYPVIDTLTRCWVTVPSIDSAVGSIGDGEGEGRSDAPGIETSFIRSLCRWTPEKTHKKTYAPALSLFSPPGFPSQHRTEQHKPKQDIHTHTLIHSSVEKQTAVGLVRRTENNAPGQAKPAARRRG